MVNKTQSSENIQNILGAVEALLSVCDGANERDNAGYNSIDAPLANYIANLSKIDDDIAYAAYTMLHKYQKQLKKMGIDYDKFEEPTVAEKPTKVTLRSTVNHVSQNDKSLWNMTVDENRIKVTFPYNETIKDAIKGVGAKFDWNNKSWNVPLRNKNLFRLRGFIIEYGDKFTIHDLVYDKVDAATEEEDQNTIRFMSTSDEIMFEFEYNPELIDLVKSLQGRRFSKEGAYWYLTLSVDNVNEILAVAVRGNFKVHPDVLKRIQEYSESLSENLSDSHATEANLHIKGLNGTLKPFQIAGVKYATKNKNVLIGDEMGLGKTVEALATLEHNKAYPALIVCPATLKLNWAKEVTKWLPNRSTKVFKDAVGEEDITIINYDILSKIDPSVYSKFISVVFDESHKLKNYKAKRTQLASEIALGARMRIMLTGTPIVNRPIELVSQLRILNRLKDFGGFGNFTTRFCDPQYTQWGKDFSGSSNINELHEKLRKICFIRREKKEVLKELPDKQRSIVPVNLSNKANYRKAKTDLINFLKEAARAKNKDADEKAKAAKRAETLVRINTLRQVAAQGKIKDTCDWISDFLETGEKLVVFAHHIEVQKAILTSLPKEANAVSVMGKDSMKKRQAAVETFQDDKICKIIVCSLDAGGEGITLTAASNVVFVELGWNPAKMDQAEDRCHRIGQKNSVNAWYFLAEDTIDDFMWKLVEEKRNIIEGAISNKDKSIYADLVKAFKKEARAAKKAAKVKTKVKKGKQNEIKKASRSI